MCSMGHKGLPRAFASRKLLSNAAKDSSNLLKTIKFKMFATFSILPCKKGKVLVEISVLKNVCFFFIVAEKGFFARHVSFPILK